MWCRMALGGLQQRRELFGEEQHLVIEQHEHVMLLKASFLGCRVRRHLFDHQAGAPGQCELLPQHLRRPRQSQAERFGMPRCCCHLAHGLDVRSPWSWWCLFRRL